MHEIIKAILKLRPILGGTIVRREEHLGDDHPLLRHHEGHLELTYGGRRIGPARLIKALQSAGFEYQTRTASLPRNRINRGLRSDLSEQHNLFFARGKHQYEIALSPGGRSRFINIKHERDGHEGRKITMLDGIRIKKAIKTAVNAQPRTSTI
ncbi:MAG: hypothetical protein Q8R15_03630 [Candidatus Micrarchaeota archaeon]|nr:hypothetical protein [Candidatus Micrarchaeota archaeon]